MTTTTTARPGAPLRTITLGQLLEKQFPPREDLVAPWLRQGESAMLFAPAGLGKSMLALTLALAVAGGGKVLGWTSPKPRPVLYLDGEMNIQDLRDRLAMLAGTVEGLDVAAAGQNLTLLSRQDQKADVRFPDLCKEVDQDEVLRQAEAIKAELVICDNFSTLAELSDENEAAAMSPVLTFLLRMKQAGRATILVHHSDKTASNYRGSSKLATTFEVIIGLFPIQGRTAEEGTGFELRWTKYRGKPTAATRDMEAMLEDGPDGDVKWGRKAASGAEMAALLDAVRSGAFKSQQELAEHLKMDKRVVSRLKGQAIDKRLIGRAEWDACMADEVDAMGDF